MLSIKRNVIISIMLITSSLYGQGNEWCGYCRSVLDGRILHKYNLKDWFLEVTTTNERERLCKEPGKNGAPGVLFPAYIPC